MWLPQISVRPGTETVTIPWKRNPAKESFPPQILAMTRQKSLTEIVPASVRQDEKPLTVDRECFSGKPLRIRGQRFDRGFGCHARSELVFRLSPDDGWKMFTARCGIDNTGNRGGSVAFKVYTDGKLAFDTGKMTYADSAAPVWADLTGGVPE